ncbi:HAMP domain-containing histidine kinase [Kineothrix sp. MSJ-39]|uniref:sensor histidine kinase n=1 Tax=Kineothrix sp. MSJ-39 TaxID=2841533 RepID=UPI001C12712B|nr:HAMP domain-containing sensor histidine kinase [Kineothrix sp. MSJ-39]MBU5430525.1 HAMP domain-containing histidine kinase [Kineothrix sp. MSJ-39]
MIKQLQRRFINIAMLSFCIVVFLIVGLTNVLNYVRAKKEIEENLSVVLENLDVIQQTEKNWKWSYGRKDTEDNYIYAEDADTKEDIDAILSGVRFFTVTLDADGNVIKTNTRNTNTVDAERASEIALDLYQKGKKDGYGKYSRYKAISSGDNLIYVFVNCKRKLRECNNFLKTSLISAIIELIAVFFPVYFFSRSVVRPLQESVDKQKAFITNAGHELKTPLTIIDANTDVIELTSGETEWTKSIRNQVLRLTKLTEEMVSLTKLQEVDQLTSPQKIQLSALLQEACEQFETVAKTHGKELVWEQQETLWVYGDEAMLERLFSILLDNAIKYADEKSVIRVTVRKNGKYTLVEVRNQAENMKKGKHMDLFERFYRADISHNSATGGHGIGLSNAQAIVELHRGKITAYSPSDGEICFQIRL